MLTIIIGERNFGLAGALVFFGLTVFTSFASFANFEIFKPYANNLCLALFIAAVLITLGFGLYGLCEHRKIEQNLLDKTEENSKLSIASIPSGYEVDVDDSDEPRRSSTASDSSDYKTDIDDFAHVLLPHEIIPDNYNNLEPNPTRCFFITGYNELHPDSPENIDSAPTVNVSKPYQYFSDFYK